MDFFRKKHEVITSPLGFTQVLLETNDHAEATDVARGSSLDGEKVVKVKSQDGGHRTYMGGADITGSWLDNLST